MKRISIATMLIALFVLSSTPFIVRAQSSQAALEAWLSKRVKPDDASNPAPASGSVDVAIPVSLSWTATGATRYDVRLSTSSTPSTVIASNITSPSYTVSNLQAGTKYYWRINAKNSYGTLLGPIWNFTTASSVPPPPQPQPPPPTTGLPAVPGAYGYGMNTRAAYACGPSPTIVRVTNLNDTGTGSLRAALESTFPRFVIFEVSGYVDAADTIRITSPCITVAGQTAPTPGIALRKYGLEVTTHDVLLQHFRIRPGEWGQGKQDNCGIIAYGTDAHEIVLDHLSVSWGPDENIAADTYFSGDMNMTVWRSITAEGLDYPASVPASASHGLLVMAKSRKVAIIESLLMTNRERNPYAQSDASYAAINNVVFNAFALWHFFFANFDLTGNPGGGPWFASVIGNRLIAGSNTDDDPGYPQGTAFYFDKPGSTEIAGNQVYSVDNTIDSTIRFDASGNELSYSPFVTTPPARAPISDFPAAKASTTIEAFVKQHAGARPLDRDGVDTRLIADLTNRIARGYRNHQDLYGGYPPMTPGARALTPPADPHTTTSSGYTNLEVWSQQYSVIVGE